MLPKPAIVVVVLLTKSVKISINEWTKKQKDKSKVRIKEHLDIKELMKIGGFNEKKTLMVEDDIKKLNKNSESSRAEPKLQTGEALDSDQRESILLTLFISKGVTASDSLRLRRVQTS